MSMKLIKKINTNYALALDSQGEQIIVEGKGIGFHKMPCEITDLSEVKRTYYNTKEQYIDLIHEVPETVLEVCEKIFELASRMIGDKINPNLTFILADHIQFSIERYEKNIDMKMPLYYDIEYLYPKESKVAEYALQFILEDLQIPLPDTEKTGIAMNIINSELYQNDNNSHHEELVDLCTSIVERSMNMKIRRDSFHYSRFVTHLHYLLRRMTEGQTVSTDNIRLYQMVSIDYPEVKRCVDIMESVLKKKNLYMNEEEKLYLMMHVNRLCTREDCNRKEHNPTP